MEAFILQAVCGGPHIIKIRDVLNLTTSPKPALVFEYIQATTGSMEDIYMSLSPMEVKHYLKQLLEAIIYVHSVGVVHRDVQPINALINKATKQLTLIDFGASNFHDPNAPRHFRGNLRIEAPEVLLDHAWRDYKSDMWSFGIMLASATFRKFPFLTYDNQTYVMLKLVDVSSILCLCSCYIYHN